MDLLTSILSLSPVPGMGAAAQALATIYTLLESIKIYRLQCRDLSNRSVKLLLALRDNVGGLEGTAAQEAVDEAEAVVMVIQKRMQVWASYSRVKSLVQQKEIKRGIEASNREIDGCMQRFGIAVQLDLTRTNRDAVALQERYHDELRETLHNLINNTDDIRALLDGQRPNQQSEVAELMQTIQEELHDPNLEPAQDQEFQSALWELHTRSRMLPPLADLSGQVEVQSTHPLAYGGFNDIYRGEWLGQEPVALKFPRPINKAATTKKKFLKEVEIWRSLQHPNVCRLYGIVYIDEFVYSVSPWMTNGNTIEYMKSHPDVDRLRILSDVALGMSYLHSQRVVHGDLRGVNILIDDSGRACLSDFGLSKILEGDEAAQQTSTGDPGGMSIRWSAPELIRPPAVGQTPISVSYNTDVWSFGMTCLEMMTGEQPFRHCDKDIMAAMELISGRLPGRPAARGLDDRLWRVIQQCWDLIPEARPTMSEVKEMMKMLQSNALSASPSQMPLSISPPSPHTLASPQTLASPPNSRAQRSPIGPRPSRAPTLPSPSASLVPSPSSPPQTGKSNLSSQMQTMNRMPSRDDLMKIKVRSDSEHTVLGLGLDPRPSGSLNGLSIPLSPASPALSSSSSMASLTSVGLSSPTSPLLNPRARNGSSASAVSWTRPFTATTPSSARPIPIRRPNTASAALLSEPTLSQSNVSPAPSTSNPSSLGSSLLPVMARRTTNRNPSVFSSDSSVSMSSRLDMACRDPDSFFRLASDGSVEAGTLEGLIGRLLADPKDPDFQRVFFTTYFAFTDSRTLLDALFGRFHDPDLGQLPGERRAVMQYCILEAIKDWVQRYYVEKSDDLLAEVKKFCSTVTNSRPLMESANQLAAVVDYRMRSLPSQLSPIAYLGESGAPQEPEYLAVALTIFESERYNSISPGELVVYLRRLSEGNFDPAPSTSVDSALIANKKIGDWVKKSILYCGDVEKRQNILRFFCNTAEECRKLRNYASMASIVEALQSPDLMRLSVTRKALKKTQDKALAEMAQLVSSGDNSKGYRKMLSKSRDCVPCLDIHVRDFKDVFTKASPTLDVDNHVSINFARCRQLEALISSVLHRHKTPDLSRRRDPRALVYVDNQLRKVPEDCSVEFYKRSHAISTEERSMHQNRSRELKAMGFAL